VRCDQYERSSLNGKVPLNFDTATRTKSEMKKTNSKHGKASENKINEDDLERKKEAWIKYERTIRRARTGYSELELDE
jgi:hypothetical protein